MEDWQARLLDYSKDQTAGKSEYERALQVYRGKTAMGDTEGAQRAKTWSDQVNTAIGGIGNSRPAQINNTLDTIGQKVNAKPFEFKQTVAPYNPANIQNDPAYQAALREAQRNTQTAAGNTAAAMNARGIMDSTITTDRVGQQAQQQYGHVSDTILPQLMQQAYARYQDEVNNDYRTQVANYGAGQDQLSNLSKYAGTLNGQEQQDFTNNLANKNANLNALQTAAQITGQVPVNGPKDDWRLLFQGENATQFNPTLQGQQYADNKVQQGIENTRADKQLNATLSNMSSDNARANASEARQAGNQQLANLYDIWDRTGVAPAGIPGVTAGAKLKGKESTQSQNDNESIGNLTSDIDQMTPENKSRFFKEKKSEIISEYGVSGYNQLYGMYFDKYDEPK